MALCHTLFQLSFTKSLIYIYSYVTNTLCFFCSTVSCKYFHLKKHLNLNSVLILFHHICFIKNFYPSSQKEPVNAIISSETEEILGKIQFSKYKKKFGEKQISIAFLGHPFGKGKLALKPRFVRLCLFIQISQKKENASCT